MQNLKCVGATVIEFQLFNQILKKENMKNVGKLLLGILRTYYIKSHVGVTFYGDLHLDVRRC